MSGELLIVTFLEALWDVVASGFAARPLMWSVTLVWIAALMFAVWDGLERKGWRATGWGCVSAAGFGLWLAIA